MIEFPSFDTVKTTPFAYRFLRKSLPNLSSDQWFYCLFAQGEYFASKENQPLSRIEDVYKGIGPFWRPLGPLPSVTDSLTETEPPQAAPALAQEIRIPWAGCRAPPLQYSYIALYTLI